MYRVVIFVDLDDPEQAKDVAEDVATFLDERVGVPRDEEDRIPYILTVAWEGGREPDDSERAAEKFVQMLEREGAEMVLVPRPSNLPLQ